MALISSEEVQPDIGGIRRLELPLPFHPGSVNVYLVPQENGWILVDCGMDLPDVLPAYELAGVEWSNIRQTLLTHAHPDHSGLAARIRALTGAPVCMHRSEEDVLKSLRSPERWLEWQDGVLRMAGVPALERDSIGNASLELRRLFPAIDADCCIGDGESISTSLGPMEAVLTPGHSSGHLCLYFPQKKILLAGDQLLKPGTPHLEWHADGSALTEFRDSLERLKQLDVEWVLPSHGRVFSGHQNRIDSILDYSHRMAQQVRNLQANGCDSGHDLALAYWNRPMHPFDLRNAVFEMLAYVQHSN